MRYISVILLIILLVTFPSCKYFKNGTLFGKRARAQAIEKAQNDSVRAADSLQEKEVPIPQIENAGIDTIRKTDENRMALESEHKYHIIVGSFITSRYAKMMSEEYRKQGYDPKIIKKEGSRFELVSIEGHDSFRNAIASLNKFRDSVHLESWLYVKK